MNESIYEQKENMTLDNSNIGLAIAALVLGILSICMSFLVIGIFLSVIGFLLGIASRKSSLSVRLMAQWGVGLSIIGFILSIGITSYYYHTYREYMAMWEDWKEVSFEEWVGEPASDFAFIDLNGKEMKLSDFEGKKIILDFWATWCSPCVQEIPHFIELQNSIPESQLTIIGISDENIEELKEFSQKKNINYIIGTSSNLPAPFDEIMSIPTTFFIDSNGIIRNVLEGYHDLDDLQNNIDSLDEMPESEINIHDPVIYDEYNTN